MCARMSQGQPSSLVKPFPPRWRSLANGDFIIWYATRARDKSLSSKARSTAFEYVPPWNRIKRVLLITIYLIDRVVRGEGGRRQRKKEISLYRENKIGSKDLAAPKIDDPRAIILGNRRDESEREIIHFSDVRFLVASWASLTYTVSVTSRASHRGRGEKNW